MQECTKKVCVLHDLYLHSTLAIPVIPLVGSMSDCHFCAGPTSIIAQCDAGAALAALLAPESGFFFLLALCGVQSASTKSTEGPGDHRLPPDPA